MPNFFEEALTDPIILTVTSLQLAWGIYACYQLNKLKNHDSRQKINYYSFESIPSTFVTIGLFGTCLGIAIGLYHFDVNPTNIKSSVQLLLRGLKSAFFTTILGLLFSLIFKQIINHFLNKFADIQPPDSPELQQLREMNTNLRLLGENISESFRRKFDVFIDDMRETNEKLIHNLSTFTANLAEQNQEALIEGLQGVVTDLNEGFKDILGALVHDNFHSLIDSVNNLNQWQIQHKQQVEILTKKYLDISTNTEKMNTSLGGIVAKNEQLIGQNSKLNQIIDGLSKVIVEDKKFVEIVGKLSNGAETIESASITYSDNLKELKAMKKSIDTWFAGEHGIKESTLLLQQQLTELSKIQIENVPVFNERLKQTFGTLDKILLEYHKAIPKIVERAINSQTNN